MLSLHYILIITQISHATHSLFYPCYNSYLDYSPFYHLSRLSQRQNEIFSTYLLALRIQYYRKELKRFQSTKIGRVETIRTLSTWIQVWPIHNKINMHWMEPTID